MGNLFEYVPDERMYCLVTFHVHHKRAICHAELQVLPLQQSELEVGNFLGKFRFLLSEDGPRKELEKHLREHMLISNIRSRWSLVNLR